MADALLRHFRSSLPEEVATQVAHSIEKLESGDYEGILRSSEAKLLFGHEQDENLQSVQLSDFDTWNDFIFQRLGVILADRSRAELQAVVFCIGYAALLAFVQSNVTGPPLAFDVAELLLPSDVASDKHARHTLRQKLLAGFTVDGIAAYKLTPNIELLCLADAIFTNPAVLKNIKAARWAKLRSAFFHQRLLSEVSSTIQEVIYDDLGLLDDELTAASDGTLHVEFLLERASIHIHHGLDKFAREDLEKAKAENQFQFALVGMLGKRTKYQQKDVSQLVVLAKSVEDGEEVAKSADSTTTATKTKPENLDLNDDTLLESISFTKDKPSDVSLTEMQNLESLPTVLQSLDPGDQPKLQPLDSTILLLVASSITNTSPQNGLTREETLPYATRVLDGGSSNWQVYTQALLVRSRIEGYKSRTIERGLLQLQALVDQVIAETTPEHSSSKEDSEKPAAISTFLPKATESESAPVTERVRYIFQLATPTRWELEAELASRWVQLGGLRSALEIYERLEMWAEAALCWAATEREDKAKRIVRRQLFHAAGGGPEKSELDVGEDEEWLGPARDPAPLDAPRLYCILGDIDQSIDMYEKAWEVSNQRYARAQRSIGRHFMAAKDMVRAAEAYSKSLRVNQLNQQSWFALGCALLELAQFKRAVEAFSRCVQLDDTDAESWSNLAAALLRTDEDESDAPVPSTSTEQSAALDDEDELQPSKQAEPTASEKRQQVRFDALKALKRAASLKHESHRIWENVLIVAASLRPPSYQDILTSQRQIIQLRGPTDGEKCIDIQILSSLVNHIISSNESGYDPNVPGLTRMTVKFIDEHIVPLITSSAELWHLVTKLALWRNKPSTALDAEEKAWRAVTNQPGWESNGKEEQWNAVVEATVRLCDSYESLGPKERTEGMAAGSGEVVMKDWKFKARSALRGIMGRGKDSWEGTEGWERLRDVMEQLRG
ncbi:TPR repeat-containing protein [Cercospora beticola]|uniref:TPR repeat-containing protein n=1 Tax=Cercospora beticola TaxID=122368 RepID=A0A2G5I215_CERBT|nr:TPR repeat-containing protein [Cercospora beticola]PIA98819.1 TPR repeat-containing protein [Cercospora beticola]WPB00967.1 hypothetical protein RHO25_005587 [Cercospora beticola]